MTMQQPQVRPFRAKAFKLGATALSGGILFMAPFAAAFAQDANVTGDSEQARVLERVVVTSTKRDQTIQEAPLSVAVVGEDIIQDSGATNFSELVTLIPSVVFSSQQSPVQSNVGIRGVTTAGGSAALEPSVGIYVDGVFTDRTSIGIGDFNDIAAVEVLRGPQSTVFGNSSPAGVINFVTKRPEAEFGGEVSASFGNFNKRQFAGTVTGPLVEDKVLGRLSAFSNKRDGYLKNLIGEDSNDQDSFGLRGKLLFDVTENFEAVVTLEYSKSDQNCCVPVFDGITQAMFDRFATASPNFPFVGSGVPFPANQVEDLVIAVDGKNRFRQELFAGTVELNWDLGGHDLKSITAYRDVDQLEQVDIDFTGLDLLNFPNVDRTNQQFSQELRLTSPSDQQVTYLVGVYFFQKDVSERSGLVINPSLAGLLGGNILPERSPSQSDITNKNYALFGEATFEVTDRFSLTGGLRYNFDDKNITASAERLRGNGTPLSPIQTIPAEFQQRDGGELTGKIVGQYEWNQNWNSYLSYTRGYKAFGINDDANLLRNIPGASFFFDSEIVNNFEFGTKGFHEATGTTLSVVAFRTAYDDFQSLASFTDTGGNLRFFLQNAASLISQGVEIDFSSSPNDNWTFSGGLTYLDATFDSFPNAQGPTGAIDKSGDVLFDAPKWSGSLVARYTRPIGDAYKVYSQGDMFFRSKVFTDQDLDPLEVQDGYTKFNLRIGFGAQDGNWAIEAWGRNLTDEITFGRAGAPLYGAVTGLLPFAGAPSFPTGPDTRIKFTGEPRTYGVTLIKRF
jgi:iron complex outermembrane receptor protein